MPSSATKEALPTSLMVVVIYSCYAPVTTAGDPHLNKNILQQRMAKLQAQRCTKLQQLRQPALTLKAIFFSASLLPKRRMMNSLASLTCLINEQTTE